MTSRQYTELKYSITSACNNAGLPPADVVGVLSAVLAEAKEQMNLELTAELIQTQAQQKEQEEPDNEHV